MSNPKSPAITSTDWTHLLTDPDLISHLGQLLQAYREAPPDKRDDALVAAMREIKRKTSKDKTASSSAAAPLPEPEPEPVPTTPTTAPPFEPDIFTPSWGQDRRRFPRLKCFVAVELSVEGTAAPVWGNLSNTSMGGCYVETVTPIHAHKKVEIGLWVANGKIWVKGIILNGTVTQSNPSFGVRVKFADMEPQERESLKQFLKFVETTTKGYRVQHGYLAQMKR